MKSSIRLLLLIALVSLIAGLGCSDDPTPRSVDSEPPRPTIPEIFYSHNVGDSLRIYVGLPYPYLANRPEPYHTVYVLDGDWYSDGSHWRYPGDGIQGLLRDLAETGTAPKSVLIGIGYEGTGDNRRGRDYHTYFENFHDFVKEELIPRVDSALNTDASAGRTIIGHSSGAYAAMRFFVRRGRVPSSEFDNFIALSGDYGHDGGEVYLEEFRLWHRLGGYGSSLPLNLFLAAGSDEEARFVVGLETLRDSLENHAYQDFRIRSVLYPGVGHGTHWQGFPDGLKWVFDWQPITDSAGD